MISINQKGLLRNHLGHILSISNHCYHLWSLWAGATKQYPKTRMAIFNILNTVLQIKFYHSNTSYGVIKHGLNISTCQNTSSWSLVGQCDKRNRTWSACTPDLYKSFTIVQMSCIPSHWNGHKLSVWSFQLSW